MILLHTIGSTRDLAAAALWLSLQAMGLSPLQGQELRLSTRSLEAQAEFRTGLDAIENLRIADGVLRMQRAINADPGFALARAFHAAYATGLSTETRETHMQQAAADAMNGSVGELSVVLALRAEADGERRSLLKAAMDAVPDDRHVLFLHASSLERARERARAYESVIRRFPEFAPPYRELGYAYARELLDLSTGLLHMQRYLRLQPDNPYAHHAVAEVLQRSGRYAEAAEHYNEALGLDGRFVPAHAGLAEVALLERTPATARAQYDRAITHERTAPGRFRLRGAQARTLVADGKARVAMRELNQVANEADAAGYQMVAAEMHRELAVLEAAYGNRGLVDSRIRKAAALSNPGNVQQQIFAAAAYALAGDVRGARPYTKDLRRIAENTTSVTLKRQIQGVIAIVEASADNIDAAAMAADEAGPQGALAKALLADSLKRGGKPSEARALANEALANTDIDLFAVIARQRAASN